MGDWLRKVLGLIGSELWFPWQQIAPIGLYEGCSNMNVSSFITFVTFMLRQNGFYKVLYVIFKLAPDLKKNTVYLLSYSPLN